MRWQKLKPRWLIWNSLDRLQWRTRERSRERPHPEIVPVGADGLLDTVNIGVGRSVKGGVGGGRK